MSRKIEYFIVNNEDLIQVESLNEVLQESFGVFTDFEIALEAKEKGQTILMLVVLK